MVSGREDWLIEIVVVEPKRLFPVLCFVNDVRSRRDPHQVGFQAVKEEARTASPGRLDAHHV
jgi:hypothetical protein